MSERFEIGGIPVDIVFKDIRNIHLSVYPPSGAVRISAPRRMALDTIRVYAITKLDWIRQQRKKLRAQEREAPREYIERESHYVWGKRYLLRVHEDQQPPSVELTQSRLILHVRPGTDTLRREALLEDWYRAQVRSAAEPIIARWEPVLGVTVARLHIQRMKTRWGSCNHAKRSIRLNTELAKKPRECLQYIVVHEMVHLLEPTHTSGFTALLDLYLPTWRAVRDELNRLPLRG